MKIYEIILRMDNGDGITYEKEYGSPREALAVVTGRSGSDFIEIPRDDGTEFASIDKISSFTIVDKDSKKSREEQKKKENLEALRNMNF